MQTPVKFSSCRGVTFEINNPHENPFTVTERSISKRLWPFASNSKVFPSFSVQRSTSRASSHFCDLDLDDDDEENDEALQEEDNNNDVEKQQEQEKPFAKPAVPPAPAAPKKSDMRLSVILLDQGLFTVYKRLFTVSLILNITALVVAATGHFPYARNNAALFSIANILALILCRSELFLRLIFYLAVKILGRSWVPLFIKTATTSLLQSVGGIHSGCGISSIAWLLYALILTLKQRDNTSPEIIAVSSAILGFLCISSLAAFPLVRHLHHNIFERLHRFSGWFALALVWAFIILRISYDPTTKSYRNEVGNALVHSQEFWMTVAITVLIVAPWLTVRRVPVRVTSASGHASIIKFEGGIKAGILGRISPHPLSEWHAFGIISDDKKEHMMLAGAVGDFTKSLVAKPPTHLWVRQVHFAGLPYLTNMYDRVLLVATGSGICVFLSFLLQPCKAEVCVLWVTKGVEQNFGKEIKEMMSGHSKEKVIVHDTAVLGRPNVSEMSVNAANNFGAQVVIVTSNPQRSRDVVNACKANGIAAFGPIWDS
ncbi:hypothetical protein HN51_030271 [Arachis hypogaea]|uniref:Adenylate-forming reductase n=2 Tax=Arachis hypogaea TaxID=3818 RepID=A0A445BBT5_ARAHY|nr:uncharacterized protein DS421_10g288800 [Arachis hypogaea]RYR36138.1 hypothetical protein Ahy_A10g051176 isoform C [Arachis hypogaea]